MMIRELFDEILGNSDWNLDNLNLVEAVQLLHKEVDKLYADVVAYNAADYKIDYKLQLRKIFWFMLLFERIAHNEADYEDWLAGLDDRVHMLVNYFPENKKQNPGSYERNPFGII